MWGSAVAAVVVVVAAALHGRRGPQKNSEDDHPDLTSDEIVAIFGELHRRVFQSMQRIMPQIKAMQAQIPNPEHLKMIIVGEFEKNLLQYQEEVFKQHNADEEDVKHSTWYYIDHKNDSVKEAVQSLQELYGRFGGEVEAEVPEEIDVHTMCQVLEEYFDVTMAIQARVLKETGGQMTEMVQMQLQTMVQSETDAVLKKYGLNTVTFQAGCTKFKSDPVFQKKAIQMSEQSTAMSGGP